MSKLEAVKSIGSSFVQENGNVLTKFADALGDHYNVSLEEFLNEAKLQREREASEEYSQSAPTVPLFALLKGKVKNLNENEKEETTEKISTASETDSLENANRMLRSASWGSVFYLITTDILGPTSAPYAISQLGYVPGSLLYFLFGICAVYTGFLLWRMFLKLDSYKYPLKNYGDLVGRVCGKEARICIDILQSIQLVCNVAVIILGNGMGLSQIAKGKGCYTVLILVWALAGMIVGQIRSLQKFGFLANIAIWMNVFVIIATMACVAHSEPNYVAALGTMGIPKGPKVVQVIVKGGSGTAFTNQLTACMNIVYSYGGAMVFVEFMSEMRRPWDFWKGMITAQSFIFSLYLLYGLFVYSQQGQFVINPANQGISAYGMQTATNVVNLVSALIAAGLYGNVGIKVLYTTFIQKIFKTPDLNTKVGRFIWIFMVCTYWGVAFVIASAIPEFSALTGLVGAVCILQFTYTFPPLVKLVFDLRVAALKNGSAYDTNLSIMGTVFKWLRAYKENFMMNSAHLFLFLAALATAALGIYSSAESLAHAYSTGVATSFTCKSPVA